MTAQGSHSGPPPTFDEDEVDRQEWAELWEEETEREFY